jgi:gas vesicle protein
MKEEITNRKGSILMPFLAGGFVGAGVALMLAPQTGSETRKDLKRFASTTREKVVSAIDKGKDLYVEGKHKVMQAM